MWVSGGWGEIVLTEGEDWGLPRSYFPVLKFCIILFEIEEDYFKFIIKPPTGVRRTVFNACQQIKVAERLVLATESRGNIWLFESLTRCLFDRTNKIGPLDV